jgi:hypothetical protein
MRKMSRPEKTYLIIIIIVLALLSVKSLVLDEYHPKDEIEAQVFAEYHQQNLTQYQNILRVKRIVGIVPISEPDNLEHSIKYEYKLKIRHYLLGIIPYWEISDYVYN